MIVGGGLLLVDLRPHRLERVPGDGGDARGGHRSDPLPSPSAGHTRRAPHRSARMALTPRRVVVGAAVDRGYRPAEGFAHAMLRPVSEGPGFRDRPHRRDPGRRFGGAREFLGAILGGWLCQRIDAAPRWSSAASLQGGDPPALRRLRPGLRRTSRADWIWWISAGIERFTTGQCAPAAIFTATRTYASRVAPATDYTVQPARSSSAPASVAATSGLSAKVLGYDAHFLLAAILSAIGIFYVARYSRSAGVPSLVKKIPIAERIAASRKWAS